MKKYKKVGEKVELEMGNNDSNWSYFPFVIHFEVF